MFYEITFSKEEFSGSPTPPWMVSNVAKPSQCHLGSNGEKILSWGKCFQQCHWKPMFQQVTNISNIQSLGDVWGGTMFILSCEKFQGNTVLLNSKFMTSYTSLNRFHSSMHELTLEKLTDHRKKYVYIVCHFKVSWCFRRFDSYSLVIWLVYLLFLLWNFATPENNKKHMVTTFQLRANAPCTRSICTMSWQSKADFNRWLNVSSSCKGIFSLR